LIFNPKKERFEIRRQLGSGSFGAVFEAFDHERQTLVALKRPHEATAQALYLFKQEFRALADISHPNLACLHELHADAEPWFFTMERVDGVNFLDYLRREPGPEFPTAVSSSANPVHSSSHLIDTHSTHDGLSEADSSSISSMQSPAELSPWADSAQPSPPPDFERVRDALWQLTEGLTTLHAAGKLHRDLKPSNVLVTTENRVVLLDFGLVIEKEASARRDPREGKPAGTPAYMAPELIRGDPASEASDWYSVGVMLYQALTGCLPFPKNYHRQMAHKLQEDPIPPRVLVHTIPTELDLLCTALLQRTPEFRPRGRQILEYLQTSNRIPGTDWNPAPSPLAARIRQAELQALLEHFAKSRKGECSIAFLHGPSGMGKSYLTRLFLKEVQQRASTAILLQGRCYEQESVPYKALDGLVDALSQYLRRLSTDEQTAILPEHIHALVRLFPVLDQFHNASSSRNASDIPDAQELRHRAFLALREILSNIAAKRPLVLVIDDIQWGDLDSATFLSEILRPPDAPPIMLLICYRGDEVEHSPALKFLCSTLSENYENILDLSLHELPLGEARHLALTMLGSADPQAESQAEWIALESGGNPFFVGELARYFRQPGSADPLKGTRKLDDYIRLRVSSLQEQPRRILEAMAVAGYPLAWDTLQQACSAGEWGDKALAYLRSSRLVRTHSGGRRKMVETYHDRIREALASTIAPDRRCRIHLRLAQVLENSSSPDVRALAFHFESAGDPRKAADYASLAGDQAMGTLAFDQAAEFYRKALDLRMATDPNVPKLWKHLAEALANAGRSPDAGTAFLRATEGAAPEAITRLQRRAAEEYLRGGLIDKGVATLRKVLATLNMDLPATPSKAIASILWHRLHLLIRGLDFVERPQEDIPPEQLERIDILWAVAMGLGPVDALRGADFQTRQLLLTLDAGEPFRVVRALAHETIFVASRGIRSLEKTRKLQAMTLALAERIGHPNPRSRAYLAAGIAATMQGRWTAAKEFLDRAETILKQHCTGMDYELHIAQHQSLLCLSVMGELQTLRHRLGTLLQEVREKGDLMSTTTLRTSLSYLPALAADDPARARKETGSAIGEWSRNGFHTQHLYHLVSRVNIELYAGDPWTARESLEEHWETIKHSKLLSVQTLRITMLELRARAALACAALVASPEDRKILLREAQQDFRHIQSEKIAYGDALALKLQAIWAQLSQHPDQALELLIQSEVSFEACSMRLHTMAIRLVRGRLLGDKGHELTVSAETWMKEQGIKNPARFAGMHLPGI